MSSLAIHRVGDGPKSDFQSGDSATVHIITPNGDRGL
jgi:hypothetical protein